VGVALIDFQWRRGRLLNESKRKVLILGSESIGIGDETLGFEILVNLLETLSKGTMDLRPSSVGTQRLN